MFLIVSFFFLGLELRGDILSSGKIFGTYMWREFDYCVNSRSSISRREREYIFWLLQLANRKFYLSNGNINLRTGRLLEMLRELVSMPVSLFFYF